MNDHVHPAFAGILNAFAPAVKPKPFPELKPERDIREMITSPKRVFPGMYDRHFITKDGGRLCYECANENIELCLGDDPQWQVIGEEVNWEDVSCACDHCYKMIEPEYKQ